ncbi:MAG: hypothetical protein IT258_21225 [Saprospiraceae bacterium]|nr:hypothetical protein [Saprospiraceae bacterium]
MNLIKKYLAICTLAAAVFGSCYYDVEKELYPTLDCSTAGATHSAVIEQIIRSNRYTGSHNAATNIANITLEGYIDNGKLLGVVEHSTGFSPMPKNAAKMVDCNIAKLEA